MTVPWNAFRVLVVRVSTVLLLVAGSVSGQTETLSVPPDSARWELEGQARAVDYQGRRSLLLEGGAAGLKDFAFRDGVMDVDIATPASRGFFGIQFRIDGELTS